MSDGTVVFPNSLTVCQNYSDFLFLLEYDQLLEVWPVPNRMALLSIKRPVPSYTALHMLRPLE